MKETTPNITQNKTVQVDEIKPYVVQKLMWKNCVLKLKQNLMNLVQRQNTNTDSDISTSESTCEWNRVAIHNAS